MLIPSAFAQETVATAAGQPDPFMDWLPLVAVFAIFYFMVMRPTARRQREHQAMITSLRRGDTIITSGGLVADVVKVIDDRFLSIDIGGTKAKLDKNYVASRVENAAAGNKKAAE